MILGDLVLAIHAAWVLTVVLAPLWAWRRPWLRWVHLGMMAVTVGFGVTTGVCPLTDLENWLWSRSEAPQAFSGSFLHHYIWELVYWRVPQVWLNVASGLWFGLWVAVYVWLWWPRRFPRGCSPI